MERSHPVTEPKRCPRCAETKPIEEFGVCNARPDKLNLYCKRCIREKIAKQRQDLREYRARNKKASPPRFRRAENRFARLLRKLSPSDRVREAIRVGAETQTEITRVTKLPKDEVGEALAELILWSREIGTRIVNQRRIYFVRGAQQPHRKIQPLDPSFSSVANLMPGRERKIA